MRQNGIRNGRRSRGFTFIELIVAVALTVVLMRGLLTIFTSAADLSRLSDARTEVLLEAAAAYDYLSEDVARCPFSGDRWTATTDGGDFIMLVNSRDGTGKVYVKYTYTPPSPAGAGNGQLYRHVLAAETEPPDPPEQRTPGAAVDDGGDDGDENDQNLLVISNIESWKAEVYKAAPNADGFSSDANWETTDTDDSSPITGRTDVRAVRFSFILRPFSQELQLRDENNSFVLALPVIWFGD
jgi:prepilin-type N-terminal cleavage/methylation domain-containing protein